MGQIIAVANQKGGVAKTTSVINLGVAFAERGLRVLLVDLDPQAALTFSLGLETGSNRPGVQDVLRRRCTAASAVVPTDEGPSVLTAAPELAEVEAGSFHAGNRDGALAEALSPLRRRFDVVLLDCSPSLGLLTVNALTAAREVIIPMPCEMLGHRGVGQLVDTVADIRRTTNPRLRVAGILPTMFDARAMHARAVLADVGHRFDVPVLAPPIPRSIRFAEAPARGRSVLSTSSASAGARAYRDVAGHLLRRWGIGPGDDASP
jgi:chromosome partitioning protein